MTQAAKRPSTATLRTGGSQPMPDDEPSGGAVSSGTATAASSATVASPGGSRVACSAPWSR